MENDDEKEGNASRKSVSMVEMTSVSSEKNSGNELRLGVPKNKNYEPPAIKLQVSLSDEIAACTNNQNVNYILEKNNEMRKIRLILFSLKV